MASYFRYFVPPFLLAVGFMDPGKWVTLIDGGSRFGYELAWVVCSATLLAMLLQTASARLGMVTGKHFAQVCREELPPGVRSLLWVLCEMSIITLDLTMVLGTAIGLNLALLIPIVPSLFLMAVDSLLIIAVLPLMEMKRTLHLTVAVVGIVFVCFLLDNVPSITTPGSVVEGLLPRLRHETLYAAVSIVGANVMPHNFYLHSALVRDQCRSGQLANTLSHYAFLGTLLAFGAVLVVNVAVLGVSVTEFHNTGLVVLTLQDSQTLIEQILSNSVSPTLFGLALLCAGQLSTLNGSRAGQVVSEAFFDYHIKPWQHRILIRGVSLVPVATCVYLYGNEGVYQMVMFSQVLLALNLPFTVAPLLKLTSSERIMGTQKNTFLLEIVSWLSLIVLSAVNVTLIFDLVFGDPEDGAGFGGFEYFPGFDWLAEIWGESLQSVVFAAICMGTTLSLGFLVWLIFTPLQLDTSVTQLTTRPSWIEAYARQEEEALGARASIEEAFVDSLPAKTTVQSKYGLDAHVENLPLITVTHNDSEMLRLKPLKPTEGANAETSAPLNIPDYPHPLHVGSSDDISFQNHISSPSTSSVVGSPLSTPPGSTGSVSEGKALAIHGAPIAGTADDTEIVALKIAEAEADADAESLGKDDDEMDAWGSLEHDHVLADAQDDLNVNGSTSSLQLDGPISGRSDTSIGSEGGSGSGSLSRLSGLGRAARRQFALILDEFWATIFDLHGQPIPPKLQGSSKSLLNERDDGQRPHSKQQQTSSCKNQHSIIDQPRSMDSNVLRSAKSSLLSQTISHEEYRKERRYLRMHMPVYHEDDDHQPATIHGYQTTPFPGRAGNVAAIQKARSMHLGVPLFRTQTSLGRGHPDNSDTSSLVEVYNDLFDSRQPILNPQRATDESGRRRSLDNRGSDRHLSQTEKHLGESETSSYDSSQWDPLVYRSRDSLICKWDPLVYRATGELDINSRAIPQEFNRWANFRHSPIGRGGGQQGDHVESAPLVFDELSPSQLHRDAFSIQTPTCRPETQSLWSRQPFEQLFGATDGDGLASNVRKQARCGSQAVQASQQSISIVSGGRAIDVEVLENLQKCLAKLLRLDGADWLFRRENGADEDLITAVAASQRNTADAELSERHWPLGNQEQEFSDTNSRYHARRSSNDSILSKRLQNAIPKCGKGCVWDHSLLVSFGVWCVHRVLELSLMESRPELWGKYTYVLNRLQGILEPAFSKPRSVCVLCKCINQGFLLDISCRNASSAKQGSALDHGNGDFGSSSIQSYPHPWPWGRNNSNVKGKGLSATNFLDMIKEVETAVGSRKGRTGTAAGDVAFPKGKENLASVLKRYKRRLSTKPPGGATGLVNGGRKV